MKINKLLGIVLLFLPFGVHALSLQNGDILKFTTAAGSFIEGTGATGTVFDSASLDALNGILIGTAQPTIPDIDQTWMSSIVGVTGNHRTSSPITVIDESTLDFTGWIMFAGADYEFGLTQNIATYFYDGTTFTLDYYWDSVLDNGGAPIGPLAVTDYHLHLEGTVVPVPTAFWLFGSGLIGLIGFARSKKSYFYIGCYSTKRRSY